MQQPLQTIFNAVTTANNNAESTAELAQVNNLQMEACPHSEAEIDLAEAGKTGDNFTTDIEAICQNRIDDQGQVGLNLETKISEVVVESVAEKSSKEVTGNFINLLYLNKDGGVLFHLSYHQQFSLLIGM